MIVGPVCAAHIVPEAQLVSNATTAVIIDTDTLGL